MITSDSRATTYGILATTEEKIAPILLGDKVPLAVAAGSGDVAMIKDAISVAADILKGMSRDLWNRQTAPTVGDFAKAVKAIEKKLVERFTYLRKMNIEVTMDMVLACVAREGKAALYVFDKRGLSTPFHDSPGFVCIGSGFVTGGNLLLRQFYTGTLNVDEGATLGAYIIDQVSKVDTGVGTFEGESYYFRIEQGKPILGKLKTEAFHRYKTKITEREQLIRGVWEASYVIEPARLLKMIESRTHPRLAKIRRQSGNQSATEVR